MQLEILWRVLHSLGRGGFIQTHPDIGICRISVVYGNSLDLSFITPNYNYHGDIIVRVDKNCIILIEGACCFGNLWLTFVFNTIEVFYIKNLESAHSTGRTSLPDPCESSLNGVEHMAYAFAALALGCFLRLGGPGTPCVIFPVRIGFVWSTWGITIGIFLEVSHLDQLLDLFLELVTVIGVMPFDYVELAPPAWFMTHYICLRSWRRRDIVQVKNLVPYFFTASVQRHEAPRHLTYSLKHTFVFDGRGIINFPMVEWTFDIGNTFYDISHLLLTVVFLAFYVAFLPGNHFC